jgi:cell division protein FtsA
MNLLYQSQRAMRAKREEAMRRGVIAVLDIGTFKIACLVLKFDETDISPGDGIGAMAGQAGFRVIGAATTRSRGVKFGEIDTVQETERAIRTAVQGAQKMAQTRVDHVIVALSGARPRSYGLDGEIALQSGTVEDGDIASVLAACDVPDIGAWARGAARPAGELLARPSHGAVGPARPCGQPPVGGHAPADDRGGRDRDASALRQALRPGPRGAGQRAYVSGISSLVEDEQELGAACIDMGGGSTSLSIFMKRHMIFADTVRMGGDHVTSDISHGLQIPMPHAERIKARFGGVMATGLDDREIIELQSETGDWHHDRRTVSRSELIGVMRPRIEEILEETRARLDAAGFDHLPSQRIVLTGGASLLPGLDGLASRILGNQVRLGRPLRVQGLPQSACGPAFSACVGLALFAAHPQDEWWDFETPADRYPARSVKRAVRWFRDNW